MSQWCEYHHYTYHGDMCPRCHDNTSKEKNLWDKDVVEDLRESENNLAETAKLLRENSLPVIDNGQVTPDNQLKFPSLAEFRAKRSHLVHVAVLCPPNAAVTMLLNAMGKHGGTFIMSQGVPMQVSALAKGNGQPNIQVFPMLIFSIAKEEFESWLKCKYVEAEAYQMDDILNGQYLKR